MHTQALALSKLAVLELMCASVNAIMEWYSVCIGRGEYCLVMQTKWDLWELYSSRSKCVTRLLTEECRNRIHAADGRCATRFLSGSIAETGTSVRDPLCAAANCFDSGRPNNGIVSRSCLIKCVSSTSRPDKASGCS